MAEPIQFRNDTERAAWRTYFLKFFPEYMEGAAAAMADQCLDVERMRSIDLDEFEQAKAQGAEAKNLQEFQRYTALQCSKAYTEGRMPESQVRHIERMIGA